MSTDSQSFRLGCAVWAFKGWLGGLFPSDTRHADFLRCYSARFPVVEGNTTFYATPPESTVAKWADETPEGFEFCPKLPRDVTHMGALRPNLKNALRFEERVGLLGSKRGPIFAQLPPSYGPDQLSDLTAFLDGWPFDRAPLGVEVRHPDWFQEPYAGRLDRTLRAFGAARVWLDTRAIFESEDDPQVNHPRPKPYLPVRPTLTASWTMIRLISHPRAECNDRFFDQWAAWIHRVLARGVKVYFFMHCPQEEHSPGNARELQARLEALGAPVPPLPWNDIAPEPAQLTLF